MDRRKFLGALLAAPAIVRASSLMPVVRVESIRSSIFFGVDLGLSGGDRAVLLHFDGRTGTVMPVDEYMKMYRDRLSQSMDWALVGVLSSTQADCLGSDHRQFEFVSPEYRDGLTVSLNRECHKQFNQEFTNDKKHHGLSIPMPRPAKYSIDGKVFGGD